MSGSSSTMSARVAVTPMPCPLVETGQVVAVPLPFSHGAPNMALPGALPAARAMDYEAPTTRGERHASDVVIVDLTSRGRPDRRHAAVLLLAVAAAMT